MLFHGLQNYFTEKFPSVFPKMSGSCETYSSLSDHSAFQPLIPEACDHRGREDGCCQGMGYMWGPLPQHSLARWEHSPHCPTLSLLCHPMFKCPVSHAPTTLALISPVPAHTLGDIGELELQMFTNTGFGTEWAGWAKAMTFVKLQLVFCSWFWKTKWPLVLLLFQSLKLFQLEQHFSEKLKLHFKTWLISVYLPYHDTRVLSISKDLTRLQRQQCKCALAPGFWARARYELGIRLLAQMLRMDGKIRREGKRTEEQEGQWAGWEELEEL